MVSVPQKRKFLKQKKLNLMSHLSQFFHKTCYSTLCAFIRCYQERQRGFNLSQGLFFSARIWDKNSFQRHNAFETSQISHHSENGFLLELPRKKRDENNRQLDIILLYGYSTNLLFNGCVEIQSREEKKHLSNIYAFIMRFFGLSLKREKKAQNWALKLSLKEEIMVINALRTWIKWCEKYEVTGEVSLDFKPLFQLQVPSELLMLWLKRCTVIFWRRT